MKKKKSLRSELQKLLRPDKDKITPVADEQVESNTEVQAQSDGDQQIILVPEEQDETKNERAEEIPIKELQKVETEKLAAKKELSEPEIFEQTELQRKEPLDTEIQEHENLQIKELSKPGAEEQTKLQIDTQVRLRLKKQIELSIDKNAEPQIGVHTNSGINRSNYLTEQAYLNFSKIIMGKYGFGRLKGTFSKLIFRLYQMVLKEEETKANVAGATIIKNYSNYYSTNKSVLNLITRSLGSNNSKSNKELNVPFYILENSQSINQEHSGNKQEYEKEVIKLMYRVFSQGEPISGNGGEHGKLTDFRETNIINTLKIVNSAKKTYENNNEYLVNRVYQNSNELHSKEVIEKQLIESKTRETLIDRINKITQINAELKGILLKPKTTEKRIKTLDTQGKLDNNRDTLLSDVSYKSGTKLLYDNNQQSESRALVPEFSKSFGLEKQNLSNRTSIGSHIGSTNLNNSGSTNRIINRDSNDIINVIKNRATYGSNNQSRNRATNVNVNVNTTTNTNEIIHRTTSTSTIESQNEIINQTTNISTNGSAIQTLNLSNNQTTNEAKHEIINLINNRTINGATNGSSNKNITNNIITNRITNGVIKGTINGNSSGIINRTTNIIANTISNRLENNEKTNGSPQLLLINNNYTSDSKQVEPMATQLERDAKAEERQQNTANEDSKQSEVIIHTTVANKVYTTKTRGFLKSALIQADGAISKIINSFSNNQKAESIEAKASKKNIYQERTELIQAEVKQDRSSKGMSNGMPKSAGKQLVGSSLIHCNPHIKEAPRTTEEEYRNVIKGDNQVSAKSVTSSKTNRNNNLEVEEVNQIAEKVLKIIEKKIAIQKDRRGLR